MVCGVGVGGGALALLPRVARTHTKSAWPHLCTLATCVVAPSSSCCMRRHAAPPNDARITPVPRALHRTRTTTTTARQHQEFVGELPEYGATPAGASSGRGIVFCAGSEGFNPMLVALRMLRSMGCALPAEVWHFTGELNDYQLGLLEGLGAASRVSHRTMHVGESSNNACGLPLSGTPLVVGLRQPPSRPLRHPATTTTTTQTPLSRTWARRATSGAWTTTPAWPSHTTSSRRR